ncbi:hypothetical protein JI739_23020 [Ramlibacter sp. AW1]|uniref:Catalase n=1 Tax=Ramlibacter aurantiacus TaxID=2801330 RepID=A0A936ZNX6_9BURK|nr:hypothetical protein [Ramlibacter aurantiacus]MBL0423227.1 hypothetical protein [Ramlibacter aurantiacus]
MQKNQPAPSPQTAVCPFGRTTSKVDKLIKRLQDFLGRTYRPGDARRAGMATTLGLAKGRFTVDENVPVHLRAGVFSQGHSFPCWVRFSTSSERIRSDKEKQVRGLAIKLLGVYESSGGGGRLSEDEHCTQDFTFLSQPFVPLGTLDRFAGIAPFFLRFSTWGGLLWLMMHGHFDIIRKTAGNIHHDSSPLDIAYWSCVPYQCGERHVVKCKLQPTSAFRSRLPAKLTDDYLKENLARHLAEHPASFDVFVQCYRNDASTPIEDASVEWPEDVSPFVKVATLELPVQSVNAPSRKQLAEVIAFSPGNSLMAHRPVGELNLARVQIYRELARYRHARNGKARVEPRAEDFDAAE